MKNVIKIILKLLQKFWDINLSIILFIFYIIIFLPYKILNFFWFNNKKKLWKSWWLKVEKYNIKNKYLPY